MTAIPTAAPGDDLRALFHGTSTRAASHIAVAGLVPDDGITDEGMLGTHEDGTPITEAVFLTTDIDDARAYGEVVLQVNIVGLPYVCVDGPTGYHYAVLGTITPDRISVRPESSRQ